MKQKNYLIAFICFFLTTNFYADNFYVSAAGNDTTGNGSEGLPFLTISHAVEGGGAGSGDTIFVVGTVNQFSQISFNEAITFKGKSNAVINGDTNRLFIITANSGVSISFSDITFQNMNSGFQGAVLNSTSQTGMTFTFTNCNFFDNSTSANAGGGVFYFGQNPIVNLTGCTFNNNAVVTSIAGNARGGAISFNSTTTATITNCTFSNNKIARNDKFGGAAIRVNNNANITISNSLFYNNKAFNGSGGNSDFNGFGGTEMVITNSLAQFTNNVDTSTGSDLTADFTNTAFTFTSPNLTYTAPTSISDATPIDFGNDNNDAGAWDSKINIFEGTEGTEGTDGTTSILWSLATNWSSGVTPIGDGTENIAILTGRDCNMFSDGVAVNNIKVTSELRIQNDKVFIVNGTSDVTGIVRYFRNLTNDADLQKAWYLVSSPLSGEVFDTAFANKNDIATNGSNRGIATYNPGQTGPAAWTYFTGSNINASPGKGFSMKITPDGKTFAASGGEYADNAVGFEGDFNTEDVTINTNTTGFNLLGNPYAAHLDAGTFLGAATNSNLDQSQLWVWNQASGMYEVKTSGSGFMLAPAQGFFVSVNTAGSVTFAESNQLTTGGTFQKNSNPKVKLVLSDGQNNRFADIDYSSTTTKGYDFGFEGEVFGGIPNSLDVFSQLVENNQGKKYQVQSLPISEIENMVIPIGVKAASGKEITFTAEAMNLPNDVNVFLEDRTTNTVTLLNEANASYKVTLNEDTNDVGRFYLHTTSNQVLSTTGGLLENISIYATKNKTLRMIGLPTGSSSVKLFNILGKQVMQSRFISTGIKEISLPKLTTGVYFVRIDSEAGKLNKKIVIE